MLQLNHVMTLILLTATLACSAPVSSSSQSAEAPLQAAPSEAFPFEWLAGSWVGSGFGGDVTETWLAPQGDAMLGMFRLVVDGQAQFYELFSVQRNATDWQLRLRHFNPDMTAWEARDDPRVWNAAQQREGRVAFGPVLYERIGPNQLRVSVELGEGKTEVLELQRAH